MSSTVKVGAIEFHRAEVHRGDSQRSQRRNEDQLFLKEKKSEFSETRRLKDLVQKHSERIQEGEPRYTLYNIDYTSEDGCSQTKLTCQEHVPERIVEKIMNVLVPLPFLDESTNRSSSASATVDFGRDRRSDQSGAT